MVSGAKEAADLLLSGGELSVDLSLYLQEGGSILSGGYGEVPQATGDAIVDAMVEVSIASPEIDVWINSLEQAGVNGYRGAGEALFRIYDGLLRNGADDKAKVMIYSFGDLPPAQALAALSPIAEMQGEEEDVESLKAIWLLANVGAQGMDALIGMDEAGQLNEHTMQDILYNRGYHTDEICAMVPELSACARSAKLRFVRGRHPPVYSGWDFCGTQECVTAHHETIDACADRVEGNTRTTTTSPVSPASAGTMP